ncbi:hypothetical protein B0H17DRAFT_1209375 [Mycena rosella]|uniref:Uncharacterized protein n=1 Tax=Mycena rosella TaxID=1033263 RepID=A0AAD7D2D4_MYCRO|nr:hypothetical protein B0H17DRAFT_1209375 [Mycena rosella]
MHKPRKRASTMPELPPELWMYIHRLATVDVSPLTCAYEGRSTIAENPLNEHDLQRYFRAVRTLARVCKLWNGLTHGLMYENVQIGRRFASLVAAIARPETAGAVRSIRLSTTAFDQNAAVLSQCPHVEMLVQPEFPRADRLYAAPERDLPPLHALTRIYWIESYWSAPLLHRVLHAAPNVTHITLSSSRTIGSDPAPPAFPALPQLTSLLLLPDVHPPLVHAFLRMQPPRLAHLALASTHLTAHSALPALPAVRTLDLVEHRPTRVPFPAIATLFPGLRELRYDALSTYEAPAAGTALALVCVRLHVSLPPNVGTRARAVELERHLRLLLEPAFVSVERIVLDRPWGGVALEQRGKLLARGCVVEAEE